MILAETWSVNYQSNWEMESWGCVKATSFQIGGAKIILQKIGAMAKISWENSTLLSNSLTYNCLGQSMRFCLV